MNEKDAGKPIDGSSEKVEIALLLAAGMGSRIQPLSCEKPKCLIEVDGSSLLEKTISALENAGFKELIIVTGHLAELIESFLMQRKSKLKIRTVHNAAYATTNNIYSLWLAGKSIDHSFLLLESDLIYEADILKKFVYPDKIALDYYHADIHDGTTANLTPEGILLELIPANTPIQEKGVYKTVNICSLSRNTWHLLNERITQCIEQNHLNLFYEWVIGELASKKEISLEMVDFSTIWWDEIDSPSDLSRVVAHIESGILKTGT